MLEFSLLIAIFFGTLLLLSKRSSFLINLFALCVLVVVLASLANENINFFLSSKDFENSLFTIGSELNFSNNKIGYIFLQLAALYSNPQIILVSIWAIGLVVNIYSYMFFLNKCASIFSLSLLHKILLGLLVNSYVVYFSTSAIFGSFEFGNVEYISTSHLLFQYIASSFFVLGISNYYNLKVKKFLCLIISVIFHPVALIYWLLSLKIVINKNIACEKDGENFYLIQFIKNSIKFGLLALLIAVLVSKAYVLYLAFLGFEGESIGELDFGVTDPLFVLKASFLVFITNFLFIVAINKKLLRRDHFDLNNTINLNYLNIFLKTISRVCIVSLALLVFSMGLSYRFSYLAYIAAPILFIISYISSVYVLMIIISQFRIDGKKIS